MSRFVGTFSLERWGAFVTNLRYKKVHAFIVIIALLVHLVTHYATYLPATRNFFADLPYFRLHALHEAEFVLVIFYASVVFRLKGGLTAVAITAITSIPFLLTPFVFEREPRPDELRDLAIQVAFVLAMGILIALLTEGVLRERDRRVRLALQLEESNQQLEAANKQLTGLNQLIQGHLNRLFDDIQGAVKEEELELSVTPLTPLKERFVQFLHRVAAIVQRT
jgi:hypothetical protein